jgi:hypothetical protein
MIVTHCVRSGTGLRAKVEDLVAETIRPRSVTRGKPQEVGDLRAELARLRDELRFLNRERFRSFKTLRFVSAIVMKREVIACLINSMKVAKGIQANVSISGQWGPPDSTRVGKIRQGNSFNFLHLPGRVAREEREVEFRLIREALAVANGRRDRGEADLLTA